MHAHEILHEAAAIVQGPRNATHGSIERSFYAIAAAWNWYLESRVLPTSRITAVDVCQMMVLLKIARQAQGKPTLDHFVDQAGYAGIAAELFSENSK